MKKILLVIPVLAVLCGITVLASQADTGTLVSTPAVSQSSRCGYPGCETGIGLSRSRDARLAGNW